MSFYCKIQFRHLPKMRKWSGGVLIIAIATLLIFGYGSIAKIEPRKQPPTQSPKQSAAEFFGNNPGSEYFGTFPEVKVVVQPKPFEKPHFVEVDGLDDLFASHDVFAEESRVLLVWRQLRPLLCRSDALPETAQGVKEASIAWKDLLSVIDKDKALKLNISEDKKDKPCPFSVNALDNRALREDNVLDIPCGLIDDSSISLVGIPDGRSFQIQLLGSQLASGDAEPPVILHYNVGLPGDNMTVEPFVIQNSWNNELGWGKEERCPSHRSASNLKVDGLVLCNEQVVRSSSDETLNGSQPSSDTFTNVSRASAHGDANFPFIEGNPFTATMWLGLEGFHMTVNGRHETSFPYRKKFEPWSASKVRVAGGLNVLSALAKGLPVSEDHDLVVDVEHLKAPLNLKKRLLLLVGVFSTGNNFERRMALRRTWMQYDAVRSGEVAVRFFIGLHKNSPVNFELWREAQAYGDIQLMPFVDYYSLISLKTIAICIFGTKFLPAKYVMKTDDDAFVRIDEVVSSLKKKAAKGLLYGLIAFESSPDRDKESKWYIGDEEWPHASYPPWAHGPGYIISRDIAKFIVSSHYEMELKLFKLEDVAMGIWIEQFKNKGQEVNYVTDKSFYNAGCESNYILAHYQSPRLVLCLWEKLQKEHQANCCE